ncbi:hypothetical protein [Ligilactobacillus salivarius]|uniref:hypothetical protein n=1 Tax=Ligilactobacillus salivarius TaxID=1624 RepID=UPI0030F77352
MKNKINLAMMIGVVMVIISLTWLLIIAFTNSYSSNAITIMVIIILALMVLSAWYLSTLDKISRILFLVVILIIIWLIVSFFKETYLLWTISWILAEWFVIIFLSLFINFYLKLNSMILNVEYNYSRKRNKKLIKKGISSYYCNYDWENGKLSSLLSYYDEKNIYRNVKKLLANYPVKPFIFYKGMIDEFMKLSLEELIEIKYFLSEDSKSTLDIANKYTTIFNTIASIFLGGSLNEIRSVILEKVPQNGWILAVGIYIAAIMIILLVANIVNDGKNIRSKKMLENIVKAAIEKKKMENK